MPTPVKTKALWLCSWYPSQVIPRVGIFVQQQAQATYKFADLAVIHAVGDPILEKNEYRIDIKHEPFFTVCAYYQATSNPFIKVWRMFHAYRKGYALTQKQWGQPNLIHLHILYPAGLFGWYLSLKEKLPFVITEHRAGYMHKGGSYHGFWLKMFTKLTFKRTKYAFPISESFREALIKHGLNTRFKVVPNVVDTDVFNLKEQVNSSKTLKKFRFIHIGALYDKQKNQSGILRVIARLAEKRTDFETHFIGSGDDKEVLIDLAKRLNIFDKQAFFDGYVLHNFISEELRKSDAFILFSNMEGSPCVILEAMSCGLPIIATETGGINERVNEQTGILLNIGDEQGLVEAMNFMIDNKAKYDPSVIRQKIVEKCSVEAVGKAISDVYAEVLSKSAH
jgi:glycosyltransferase involved in cell wall biosynthesis